MPKTTHRLSPADSAIDVQAAIPGKQKSNKKLLFALLASSLIAVGYRAAEYYYQKAGEQIINGTKPVATYQIIQSHGEELFGSVSTQVITSFKKQLGQIKSTELHYFFPQLQLSNGKVSGLEMEMAFDVHYQLQTIPQRIRLPIISFNDTENSELTVMAALPKPQQVSW